MNAANVPNIATPNELRIIVFFLPRVSTRYPQGNEVTTIAVMIKKC